jgi:hypothetical protein
MVHEALYCTLQTCEAFPPIMLQAGRAGCLKRKESGSWEKGQTEIVIRVECARRKDSASTTEYAALRPHLYTGVLIWIRQRLRLKGGKGSKGKQSRGDPKLIFKPGNI